MSEMQVTDDVDNDNDNDNEEVESSEEQGAEWAPPSKDEWEKVLKAKDRYKDEAKQRRLRIQELESKKSSGESGESDEDAINRARLEGENGATARYRGIIGKQAAKAAFLAAGLKGKPDGLLKLIDFEELEIDEDGEVTGLEDQVSQLKSDYPELFARQRSAGPKDKDGSDKNPAGRKPQSATEKAIARAFAARG